MSGKPLMDYTLAEVKEICKAQGPCNAECPLFGKNDGCLVSSNPCYWRLPYLTDAEAELLRLTGAKFVSRDRYDTTGADFIALWSGQPREAGQIFCAPEFYLGQLKGPLFPPIPPGVCWEVAKLLGEKEETHETKR